MILLHSSHSHHQKKFLFLLLYRKKRDSIQSAASFFQKSFVRLTNPSVVWKKSGHTPDSRVRFVVFFPCWFPLFCSICVDFCITHCMWDTFILFPIYSDYFFRNPPGFHPVDRADRRPVVSLLHLNVHKRSSWSTVQHDPKVPEHPAVMRRLSEDWSYRCALTV